MSLYNTGNPSNCNLISRSQIALYAKGIGNALHQWAFHRMAASAIPVIDEKSPGDRERGSRPRRATHTILVCLLAFAAATVDQTFQHTAFASDAERHDDLIAPPASLNTPSEQPGSRL